VPRTRATAVAGARHATARLRVDLFALVTELAEHYVAAVRAARRRTGRGDIHRLRIATRRVQALRTLLQGIDPDSADERLDGYLEAPFRRCGRLRDVQVMTQRLPAMGFDPPTTRRLARLARRLKPDARRRARRALAAAHPRRVVKRLLAAALRIDHRLVEPAERGHAARMIAQRLDAAGQAWAAARAHARGGEAAVIHRARLALKQRRYLLELVGRLDLAPVTTELERLRQVQETYGAVTDCSLMLRIVDRHVRRHPRAAAGLEVPRAAIAAKRAQFAARLG